MCDSFHLSNLPRINQNIYVFNFVMTLNIIFWLGDLSKKVDMFPIDDEVTITTSYGDIMGFKKTVLEKTVYCFLGIPFAKPPIGRLRFRKPEPMNKWKDIKIAKKNPKTCYQNLPEQHELNNPALRMWLNNTEMSEDCLYLNIWTPSLNDKTNIDYSNNHIPTMVWIHGGGFTGGSSTLDVYNGEILASKMNVIIISIQYRLGPFGFLSFNVNEIPGNQGLMDQVMALQWINENIAKFGGNTKRITIFGENAGAVSASLHLVSPLTQKLFNQAIMQSGSALSWWAFEKPSTAVEMAYYFAGLSGCHESKELSSNSSSDLFECLRSLDPLTISVNQWRMQISQNAARRTRQNLLNHQYRGKFKTQIMASASFYFDIPFKPINESEYLPMSPIYYLTRNQSLLNKKRVMLGVTKNEGIIHLIRGLRMYFMPNDDSIKQPNEFRFGGSSLDPVDLLAFYLVDEKFLHHFLIQAIAFEYQIPSRFMHQNDWHEEDVIRVLDHIAGDYSFKCPVVDFADLYLQISKVYVYSFEHLTKNLPLPKWTGILQGQEVPYIFGKPFDTEFAKNYFNFTEDEKELSINMMKFWTNFAQIGYPNHGSNEFNAIKTGMYWEKYTESTSSYSGIYPNFQSGRKHIVFNNKTLYNEKNLRRHECLFWRDFLPNLRKSLLTDTNCPTRSNSLSQTMVTNPQTKNVMIETNEKSKLIVKPSKSGEFNKRSKKSICYCYNTLLILFPTLLHYLLYDSCRP